MAQYVNHAKRRLSDNQLSLGIVLRQSRTTDIALISQSCGFDWLSIDMEHSSIDVDTAAQIASAALPTRLTALARVPLAQHHHASRLLDAGAYGVIAPHVDTAEEARFVVSYCKYPPLGGRSIASVQPQLGYNAVDRAEAMRIVNEETLVVVMLETAEAIQNADTIAGVPGIDVLLIGSNDLSADLDIAGQFSHPRMVDAHRAVADACRRHGKYAGTAGIHNLELLAKFVDFGVRFISGGTDLSFLMKAAEERARVLQRLLRKA